MKKNYTILVVALLAILSFFSQAYAQNAIVGTGFSTGWGLNNCTTAGNTNFKFLSAGTGSTYILTTAANGTGNQYFRFAKDWSSTFGQYAITPGSDVAISANTTYSLNMTCTNSGSQYINVGSTGYNYIFKTLNAGTAPTGTFVFFEVQGTVRTVSEVTRTAPAKDVPVTVTAKVSGALATGQGVYLRYTNSAYASSTVATMTRVNDTIYTATIPAATNTAAASVSYYVFTSGNSGVATNGSNADLYTINLNNNGGANYTYTVPTTYYSKGTLAPNVAANWNTNRDGTGTNAAGFATSGDVFVIQGTGGGLSAPHTMSSTSTMTFGAGVTLIVESGATLQQSSTITFNATATFQLNSGSTFIQNSSSSAAVSAGIENWSSGATVNYINSGFIATTSITGGAHPNVTISATGNRNLAGVITYISGNLVINSGTSTVTLTGATAMSLTVDGNIDIQSTGAFSLGNGTASPTLNLGGNLNIVTSGTFTYSGSGTASVNFTKSGVQTLTNGGTMSGLINYNVNSGSTLDVGTSLISGTGTFTVASGAGLITANTAGVASTGATGSIRNTGTRTFNTGANYTFNGTAAQETGTGFTGANNLTINNSAGVSLSAAATVSNTLTLTSGNLSLGNNNLTLSGSSSSISGPAAFGSTSSNYIVTNGTGNLIIQNIGSGARTSAVLFPIGASASAYNPVTVTNSGTSDNFSVRAAASVPGGLVSANAVNNSWVISEGTAGGSTATIGLQWTSAQHGANFSTTQCAVVGTDGTSIAGSPSYGAASGSSPYTRTLAGQTTFSSFYGVYTPVAATAPTVTTTAASSVTSTGASTGGNVTSDGGATVTERGVVYSTSASPTTANTKVTASGTTGSFTATLNGLTAGTTYYVRAYAINSVGTSYGSEVSFTTLALPTVTTTASSSVTASSASTGGEVTADGGATITERGVVYGTSSNPTTANTKVTASGTIGTFTSSLIGLNPGVTYYVRAYAINSVGTSYGSEISFTTLSVAPAVSTGSITSITMTSASASGNVTSDGGATISERGVVYGTSANPTTADSKVTSSGTTGSFTVSLSGLSAGTTYYVRAYAINSVGISYGSGQSFTTLNIPSVTTTAASLVTSSSASSGGNVTADGGSAITERGIVYATSSNPTTADTKITDGAATTGSFTSALTGLSAATTYYIRAYAINAQGTAYGSEESFTTTSGAIAPTVSTAAVSNLGSSTVTVGGSVDSDGGDAITERGIVYSSSSNPTTADTKVADGSATTGSFSTGLTGLTPGATYYVRAYAINSIGTSYGNNVSFTMNAVLAIVTTTAVSSITSTSAASGGNVTADGGGTITERGIVYGTSANPTTANTKVIDGSTGTGSFTSSLSGLSGVTTYYVRAYAINSAGTAYGSEETFTTLANVPTVTTASISAITGNSAAGGGNVTSDGGDAITERGIVYSTSSNPTTADTKVVNGTASTGTFTSSLSGLSPLTTYYVRAYATNSIGTSYGAEVSFTTISAIPSTQAAAVSFSNITLNGLTINFTAGDGSNSLVVVRSGSSVNADPANTQTYTANTIFGSGSQLGTGNYVVYNGTGNSVAITGLTAGTTYHVAVYSFNGSGGTESYLVTTPATGSQATATADYRSVASGNWSSVSTWETYNGSAWVAATDYPNSDKGTITIQAGHTVAMDVNISVDEMTVAATAQVNVNAGITMTINNGTGTDLTVNGTLKNLGTVTLSSSPSITVAGTYEHAVNGGTVPAATWSTGSTCLVTGVTSSTATNGFSQDFFNLTWNCPGQTANLNLGMYNTTIRGDFNFLNGGAGAQETALSLAGAGVGPNNVINILGNFNVNSSVNTNQITAHRSGTASTVTNLTVNIQGNLNITNGSFFLARSTGIATLNWNLYGNLNMTGGVFNSSHTAAQFHFAKNGTQTYTKSAGTMTAANMVIDGTSTVDAGTSAFDGTCTLTISAGATLISANASGSITTTGTKTLNAAANYLFNGTSAQSLPAAITGANNMTINNPLGVTLGGTLAVTGTLTLTSGKLTLPNIVLTLSNPLVGGSSSNYVVIVNSALLKYLAVGNTATTYHIGNSATNYTPFTLTNTGTVNNIAVGVTSSITNALFNSTKAVNLQWTILPDGAGSVINATFNWNSVNQGASFSNTASGELGQYVTPGPYSLSSLGTLSGTSISKLGINLSNSVNYLVIGNNNSIYVPQIVGFDVSTLTGGSGNFGASPYAPTTLNSNLLSDGLVRGGGLLTTGTAAAGAWGAGGGYNSATSALAISAQKYFFFQVKPKAGYSVDLLSLNPVSYRTSSTGPNAILVQYAINNGTYVDLLSTSLTLNTTAGQLGSIDLSNVAALQNVQNNDLVTFRFVPFGASSGTGTFYINNVNASTASDLALNGVVNACSVNSATPAITTPVCNGATTVSGTSTEANGTLIDLYVNGTFNQTVLVANGTWSATTSALSTGNTLTAYATATGKCLSSVSATVTVAAPTSSTTNVSVCPEALPYSWNSNSYSAAGTYQVTLTNAAGCDSVATLVLSLYTPTHNLTTITACDNYVWAETGLTYTASGTYTYNYSDINGCASVDTLKLTIKNSSSSTTNTSVCYNSLPYTWNGSNYSSAGTYTWTGTNAAGCDSVAILVLSVTYGIDWANTQWPPSGAICKEGTYTVYGQVYEAGVTNGAGAGAGITAQLGYSTSNTNPSTWTNWVSATFNTQVGNNDEYLATLSGLAPGTYYYAYRYNYNGCTEYAGYNGGFWNGTSNVSGVLTVRNGTYNATTVSACNSYLWNGNTYTSSGTYTYNYSNANGCSSTDTLHLTINSGTYGSESQVACNSYVWNGNTYTASGTYTYSYNNANGCASVDTLHLTINSGTFNASTIAECGEYTWNGTTYYSSGTYTYAYNNANGCASVDTLHLTIYSTAGITTTTTSCGDYLWASDGQTYTTSGTYTNVYINENDCIVTDTLYLTVIAPTSNTTTATACDSYVWSVDSQAYTATGSYSVVSGCHTEILNLTINESASTDTTAAACGSFVWYDNTYTASGDYNRTLTAANGCDSIITLHLTINAIPSLGAISGPAEVCSLVGSTTPTVYSVATVAGASSYNWVVPAGVVIQSGQGTNSLSVTFTSALAQTNQRIYVTAVSAAGCNSSTVNILLSKSIPAIPASISGPTNICSFVGQANNAVYTCDSVGGASGYLWTVPTGASIVSGQGTRTISVSYTNLFVSGAVTVTAQSNCGNRSPRSLTVARTVPGIPVAISGPVSACSYIGTSTQVSYTISPVANADSYLWTVPAGVSIVSGQGTTTLVVTFNQGYISSSIKVRSVANCGNSADRTLAVAGANFSAPGPISGPTNACPFLNNNDAVAIYTIRKVANAPAYIWTVPTGATIVSHPGGTSVNDTIIQVAFNSNFVYGSSITVQTTGCGTSAARSITVGGVVPSTPGLIAGPTNVCEFMVSSSNPNGNIATYTIRRVAGVSSYNWTAPANASIIGHPAGTGINDTAVQIKFNSDFVSGAVSVISVNGCGSSTARTLNVTRLNPATPGIFDVVLISACPSRVYSYTMANMPSNATSVLWTVPAGATIVSGQGTASLTVSYPPSTIGGQVTAQALNNCSSSAIRTLNIKLAACPSSFAGSGNIPGKAADQYLAGDQVTLSPNPTTGPFVVKLNGFVKAGEQVKIRVVDQKGAIVKQLQQTGGGDLQLGADFKSGVYFVEIQKEGYRITRRVVKY